MAGRPRSFDRDVALETAMREFWAHGFEGVTTAQLARAIGINQPSLYAAFGDKAHLFAESASLYGAGLDQALERDLAHRSVRRVAEALLGSAVVGFTRDDAPHGCLVMREPLLAERRGTTRAAVRRRFVEAVADGEFRDAQQAEALADYLNGVLAGIAARALDGATRAELERVAEAAIVPFHRGTA